MNIPGLLAQARALHTQTLTDTITVERPGPVTVGDLGDEHQEWDTVAAAIPALLQQQSTLQARDTASADEPIRVVDHILKTSLDADIREGDRVTVTSSLDPRNTGTWYVGDVERQGWAITRRVHVTRTWHSPSTPHS